jgi:hypothetical protein
LAVVGVLVLALMVLPAWLMRAPKASPPFVYVAYFAALGLAYLLVEVAVMQKFILYLGHPTYALAIVLFTFLITSGLGAATTELVAGQHAARRLRVVTPLLAFYAAVFIVISPRLFHETLAYPLLWRAAISVGVLAPLGWLMGMPFPLGIRLAGYDHPHSAPWMYAVNSAASVLGSVAAMLIAVHWGFNSAVTAGLALYVIAGFLL